MNENNTYQDQAVMPHSPFLPVFPQTYLFANMPGTGLTPYEFTDWRDETCSWKETCYLHAGLNPTTTYSIKGPGVIDFLSKVCVTGFTKYPVGMLKHGLMCNESGKIIQDGVLWRISEDEVVSFWMEPCINYALESGKYGEFDCTGTDLTGKVFLLQIGGPASIDTLEDAAGISLRDMRFLRSCDAVIGGHNVKIARIGMAGTLSYEVHGMIEDCTDVYNAIWEAGQAYGMRRLGQHCYGMNHAENGYPQYSMHFLYPWQEEQDMLEYLAASTEQESATNATAAMQLVGSNGNNMDALYFDPYQLGWDRMIRYDHDFVGREALEQIRDSKHSVMVSLEWDPDDVADVFADQFRGYGDYYTPIEEPNDPVFTSTGARIRADLVQNDAGDLLGVTTGRQNSAYFHRMISICSIDPDYAELGTEVNVIWGDVGTKQKKIRATVARFPYNNVLRNEKTNVAELPRAKKVNE